MRIFFAILFFLAVPYCLFFSPNQDQEIFRKLINGEFNSVELSISAVFCVLGIVPTFLGFYLVPQRHSYKPTVWPFWIGSFLVGAGALLPYLALRKPKFINQSSTSEIGASLVTFNWWEKIISNKSLKFLFAALIFGIVAFGFIKGSPEKYYEAFQSSRLVHSMSIDFCILMFVIWPYLIFKG
ncbi:MAG: hypothetical protein SFU25_05690 [Candidatus Caenarcaniphilales bacterium]|nr:hypothetical protein [Candidatus Caenarcaniphilales bacterium]